MTTRHLAPLPEQWAAPIYGLVDAARAAALPEGLSAGENAWEKAEAGHPRPRTNHKGARRTAMAGEIAAHSLRLCVLDRTPAPDRPWDAALVKAGVAFGSWDWDQRMQAALDLRKTFKDLLEIPNSARPARLVSAWLTHTTGEGLVPVTGRLCEYVLADADAIAVLGTAWYAVNGLRLVDELVGEGGGLGEGAPPREDAARRQLLRQACVGILTAEVCTKLALSRRSGITRRTLDAWLSEGAAILAPTTTSEGSA